MSEHYGLFSVTAAMFFARIKTPHVSSLEDTLGNIHTILNDLVVSEEMIIENNNIKNSTKKKMWKRALTPTWLDHT